MVEEVVAVIVVVVPVVVGPCPSAGLGSALGQVYECQGSSLPPTWITRVRFVYL